MVTKGRVRLIYAATAVAVLSMVGGMVVAGVLTITPVNQTSNFYQGGSTGVTGYSTPTLAVSTIPAATTTCTSGTLTGSSNAGTVVMIVSATTGGTVCTTGDFAELFTESFSATITTQTNTLTVTTQVGASTPGTNTESVTLGTGTSTAFTQTIEIYVDYGSVNPPASGITTLDLVVQ